MPPFEELYRQLEATVTRLEQGELSLTESERLYVQGVELARRCQQLLSETELRITQVGQPETGNRRQPDVDDDSDDDGWEIPPGPEPDDPSIFDDDDLPF